MAIWGSGRMKNAPKSYEYPATQLLSENKVRALVFVLGVFRDFEDKDDIAVTRFSDRLLALTGMSLKQSNMERP